jgi:UDP-glucose 4-epimerase
MRILVTGGAGFIGSHVVDAYIQAGHEIWVLDDLSRGKRDQVNPHAQFVRMDLRSPDLKELVADVAFDCINHHAAQIDVRVSVADPVRDAMINIIGTLNLLEAARTHKVPRMIFASTGGAIYGEQRHFPASEQHPTSPVSPYGVAKLAVEHYLEYFRQVHDLQYVVQRYSNVYGPRQDPEGEAGVVAIFCGRILRGQRLIIYGDGQQTRDYVYVQDVAQANLLALRHLAGDIEPPGSIPLSQQMAAGSRQEAEYRLLPTASCYLPASSSPAANCQLPASKNGLNNSRTQKLNNANTVFNIGTGIETSVNALAAMLLETADADCPIVYQPERSGEQSRSVIEPSKAEQILGWKPLTPLSEGLLQTFAWFRAQETANAQQAGGSKNT